MSPPVSESKDTLGTIDATIKGEETLASPAVDCKWESFLFRRCCCHANYWFCAVPSNLLDWIVVSMIYICGTCPPRLFSRVVVGLYTGWIPWRLRLSASRARGIPEVMLEGVVLLGEAHIPESRSVSAQRYRLQWKMKLILSLIGIYSISDIAA